MLQILDEVAKKVDESVITSKPRYKYSRYHQSEIVAERGSDNVAISWYGFMARNQHILRPKWYHSIYFPAVTPNLSDAGIVSNIAELITTKGLQFIFNEVVACKNLIFFKYQFDYEPTVLYVLDLEKKEARIAQKEDLVVLIREEGKAVDSIAFSNALVKAILNDNDKNRAGYAKIKNLEDFKAYANLRGIYYPYDDDHLHNSLNLYIFKLRG